MAAMVLQEMARGDIPVLIAPTPEIYGPGETQNFTNALVIDKLKLCKKPRVSSRDDTRRTLIRTPDASRALAALGNAPDAFGRPPVYIVISRVAITVAGLFSKDAREIRELLPRYQQDNLFESSKFKRRFPDFRVTTYKEGLRLIQQEAMAAKSRD